jgi:molecular chaperone DnaK
VVRLDHDVLMSRAPKRRFVIIVLLVLAAVMGLVNAFGPNALEDLDKYSSIFSATLALIIFTRDRLATTEAAAENSGADVHSVRRPWNDVFLDWLFGSARRIERAERSLQPAGGAGHDRQLARVRPGKRRAVRFRRAILLALRHDPARARRWATDPGVRPSDDDLRQAFSGRPVQHLQDLVAGAGIDALVAIVELAKRLGNRGLSELARDRLAEEIADVAEGSVAAELRREPEWWQAFFNQLPPDTAFRSFEIAMFRGRLSEAITLVTTEVQARQVAVACLASPDIGVVDDGIAATARFHDRAGLARLQLHAGQLLDRAGRRDDALTRYMEALQECPDGEAGTLGALVRPCLAGTQILIERRAYAAAAGLVELLRMRLAELDFPAGPRGEVNDTREALLAEARQSYGDRARRVTEPDRPGLYLEWYRFEEAAGEILLAAHRAEDGGHIAAAQRLFEQAGMHGDAVRVRRHDNSPQALTERAVARAAGGDLFAAAVDYRQAGNWQAAADHFSQVRAYEQTVYCLLQLHRDRAIEEPAFVRAMRSLGDFDQLVRLCLEAISQPRPSATAMRELGHLRREGNVSVALRESVDETMRRINGRNRLRFEERAQAWTVEAAADIDRRFAPTWGLDLGTSTCVVAIYDSGKAMPVLCEWHHDAGFPSTLCIDWDGREIVGMRGLELAVNRLQGVISNTKRDMGTNQTYAVGRSESYRPEEVAARLIRHGRMIVESMLARRVRERVAELARDELGDVEQEWLDWAMREHPVRLTRPRVLVTIPAYYLMKAKNATRDACVIAGVELVRLIHEPTAACVAATFERRHIDGRLVMVDFGAGTLDISLIDVKDQFYRVDSLSGETRLGSYDFDVRIADALTDRLRRAGETVPATSQVRRLLEHAAEDLKKQLSDVTEATHVIRGLNGHDVPVVLTRSEMESIVTQELQQLRQVCAKARPTEKIDHLLLIGGPARSPSVQERIHDAFNGMLHTSGFEPRTAVAKGAALQAAVLDGMITETLLMDVTPFALGIKARNASDLDEMVKLVDANANIPLTRSRTFTTYHDKQTSVQVEVYNGQLHRDFLIGEFNLDGIPPAPRNTPQIDVTFDIDLSCVLTVTAKNLESGREQSVRITDTTLLSPGETEKMRRRLDKIEEQERQMTALRDASLRLADLLRETERLDVDQLWAQLQRRIETVDLSAGNRLNADTAVALADIRRTAGETAAHVRAASERLGDARDRARRAVDRVPGPMLDAEVAELERHERVLKSAADRMTALARRLTTWFLLLTEADAVVDRLAVFRERYSKGDFRGALTTAKTIELDDPQDQERRRHALAEVRAVTEYRAAVAELQAADPHRSQAAVSLAPAVTVTVSTPDGRTAGAGGLLLADDLVVTSKEWFPDGGQVRVSIAGTPAVDGVATSATSDHLVVIRLVTPLSVPIPRLGYSALLQVGDSVEVPVGAAGRYDWAPAVVEEFLSMDGARPTTVRIHLDGIDSSFTGRPVRNDLGEVLGIVAATREFPGQATVVLAETLRQQR